MDQCKVGMGSEMLIDFLAAEGAFHREAMRQRQVPARLVQPLSVADVPVCGHAKTRQRLQSVAPLLLVNHERRSAPYPFPPGVAICAARRSSYTIQSRKHPKAGSTPKSRIPKEPCEFLEIKAWLILEIFLDIPIRPAIVHTRQEGFMLSCLPALGQIRTKSLAKFLQSVEPVNWRTSVRIRKTFSSVRRKPLSAGTYFYRAVGERRE